MTEKSNKTQQRANTTKSGVHSARSASRQTVREPMSSDEKRLQNREKRKKQRKRNRIIAYSLSFLLVIAIGVILALTVFFKIDTFAITGDEIYNSEDIMTASELETGDNMYLFNKNKVSKKIQEALPYVEKADIKRNPTGTVEIKITAARATLALDMGDSYCLLNSQGKVLEDSVEVINDDICVINSSKILSASPGFYAEFENKDDLANIVNIQKLVSGSEIEGINAIDVTDTSNIKLTYNQRIVLKLGLMTSIEKKMDFVNATLKKLQNDDDSFEGTIDFTVDNKAYLNKNDSETTTFPIIAETTTLVDTQV